MIKKDLLESSRILKLPKMPVRSVLIEQKFRENDCQPKAVDMSLFQDTANMNTVPEKGFLSPITIECDSVCHPNPGGLGCFAWVAYNNKREIIEHCYKFVGRGNGITNNVMEFHSIISALEWAWSKDKEVEVFTSSQLVAKQISGEWECSSELLKPLLKHVLLCLEAVAGARVNWIPQRKNETASYFCNLAYLKAKQDFEGGENEQ